MQGAGWSCSEEQMRSCNGAAARDWVRQRPDARNNWKHRTMTMMQQKTVQHLPRSKSMKTRQAQIQSLARVVGSSKSSSSSKPEARGEPLPLWNRMSLGQSLPAAVTR